MSERVLVCGGRDFGEMELSGQPGSRNDNYQRERDLLTATLDAIERPAVIICGGAKGADKIAQRWAVRKDVPREVYEAEWQRYGPAAGPLRNARMIAVGKPDLVVAFPGGKGTADMVRRAVLARIRVMTVSPPSSPPQAEATVMTSISENHQGGGK